MFHCLPRHNHRVWVGDIAAGPAGFALLVSDSAKNVKGTWRSTIWTSPDGQAWQQVVDHDTPVTAVDGHRRRLRWRSDLASC